MTYVRVEVSLVIGHWKCLPEVFLQLKGGRTGVLL